MIYDTIVIGGGASGFFSAINLARLRPDLSILILERGPQVLEKVRVSGGGRCNVTHAMFEPKPLTGNYPRGKKELLGPFHSFMTGDTMGWFEELGIPLKIEEDGRVFPESNSSQTIIDCFLDQAQQYGISVLTKSAVLSLDSKDEVWQVGTKSEVYISRSIILASGSSPKMLKLLSEKDIVVVDAVPSLFTFNIEDKRISTLAGLSVNAQVLLLDLDQKPISFSNNSILNQEGVEGPVLITHWGMSGPGILKLSAWAARVLKDLDYQYYIKINWLPELDPEHLKLKLNEAKLELAKQTVAKWAPFELPKRFWRSLVEASSIASECRWADLTKTELENLQLQLQQSLFRVSGKSTFKDEFVTAGGVDLKEVDFKTFQSKRFKNLYMIGEVLDIDAVTGGFNFQNAWTGGYIAAQALAKAL